MRWWPWHILCQWKSNSTTVTIRKWVTKVTEEKSRNFPLSFTWQFSLWSTWNDVNKVIDVAVIINATCSNQHMVKHFVTMPLTHLCHLFPVSLDKLSGWTSYGMHNLQRVWKTVREKNVELGSVERLLVIAFFQQTGWRFWDVAKIGLNYSLIYQM